jgi:hypothetical protein
LNPIGGRPRRDPRVLASRSKIRIASWSRLCSLRSSTSILLISIKAAAFAPFYDVWARPLDIFARLED